MKKKYRKIEFPALTKEQEEELEALRNMREEDINTDDIPGVERKISTQRTFLKWISPMHIRFIRSLLPRIYVARSESDEQRKENRRILKAYAEEPSAEPVRIIIHIINPISVYSPVIV